VAFSFQKVVAHGSSYTQTNAFLGVLPKLIAM